MDLVTHTRRGLRALVSLLPLAALLTACGPGEEGADPAAAGPPPPAVSVATVVERDVTEWDEFNGRIEAIDRVELRPRVSGYLEGVHFSEGAIVEAGALLFTIDAREYESAVGSAEANVGLPDLALPAGEFLPGHRASLDQALAPGQLFPRQLGSAPGAGRS